METWLLAFAYWLLCMYVHRYWALGFHQCRFGYPNVETLVDVVEKYASNKVCNAMITGTFYMLSLLDTTGYNVD